MNHQPTDTVDSTTDATWAVDQFRKFWANPDPAGDALHLSADIVGCWPDGRVLRGVDEYRGRLINLGAVIPDIRLEVLEYAVNGELAFIRWRAHGTGRKGHFELFGVDRLRVDAGQVKENIIHLDTATFAAVVGAPLSST